MYSGVRFDAIETEDVDRLTLHLRGQVDVAAGAARRNDLGVAAHRDKARQDNARVSQSAEKN